MWSWPWEDTAQATIVYRVPEIKGTILSSKKSLVESGVLSSSPPAWQGGRYRMTLYREKGQWKIAGMKQLIEIDEPTPTPVPTATSTPAP